MARGDDSAAVDSLLAAASDTGRTFGVREADLKEAVEQDRTGRSMHALARLHLEVNTIASRQDAGRWLRRAMEKEPESAEFRSTHAELLWASGRRHGSYKAARRAHELDPDNVRALYYAGRYAVWSWEMSHWTDVASGVDTDLNDRASGRTFRQMGYAEIDLSVGEEFLTRAIGLDPGHRAARTLLGVVYHETKRPTHLVKLFEEYQRAHPEDRDAPFFIGLGYQMKGDLKAALRSYAEGLSRMSNEEIRFVQSAVMMDHHGDELLPDREALERFWRTRDPVFLTETNERLMEHCARVAYASLRYGDPRRDIQGCQSDRGQAYIRYGPPLARQMAPADVDVGLDASPEAYDAAAQEVERTGRMPYKFRHRAETWGYD
ncbi:MAG: GWxTD domain-containing protein, partial [Candidatus Latescibacteria bacterium]|nr:GWxTD domain-containing protein [Candidatus Latescibacterota bacterium]